MLKSNFSRNKIEVGCDEAGRGSLAGPVVAAAVLLPKEFNDGRIKDSKKLSERERNQLEAIIKNHAISYGVGIASPIEIDASNILNASILAMHRAIEKINVKYELLLIDGNRFNKYKDLDHQCIIKGDSKFTSIAAASILAKTHRDKIMKHLSYKFPEYMWKKNKGYPTKNHRTAIKKYGANIHHRKSFKLLPDHI